MKSNTKKEIVLIIAILVIIIGFRYQQFMVQRNFILDVNTTCVEGEEGCFVADCSPEESEDCDVTPYKKVNILANEAPACLEEHACEAFSCSGGGSCTITLCNDESLEEGEICAGGEGEVVEEHMEDGTEDLEATDLEKTATTTEDITNQ